jgi:tetrahydromethanopterin S-methyltransferase subunit G
MMKKELVIFLSLCIIAGYVGTGTAKEIQYSLEDRERLTRLEVKVEEGLKAVNQRIDGLDKRIDGLQGLMYVVIGAVIAQTIGIVGFVLWDRRSALAPAIRKNRELEEREETIEKILKEYAKQEPRLAEILKSAKLL